MGDTEEYDDYIITVALLYLSSLRSSYVSCSPSSLRNPFHKSTGPGNHVLSLVHYKTHSTTIIDSPLIFINPLIHHFECYYSK